MSIDLDSTEGRKQYLSEKLDDLLEGINDSYGTLLMEELLTRLELTVKDFNDEMKNIRAIGSPLFYRATWPLSISLRIWLITCVVALEHIPC